MNSHSMQIADRICLPLPATFCGYGCGPFAAFDLATGPADKYRLTFFGPHALFASTAVSFSIGAPTRLPHSVHEPS